MTSYVFSLFRVCNFHVLCFAPFLCSLFSDSRVFDSEYSSRFVQPTKFKYVDGLWIETPISAEATYNVKVRRRLARVNGLLRHRCSRYLKQLSQENASKLRGVKRKSKFTVAFWKREQDLSSM